MFLLGLQTMAATPRVCTLIHQTGTPADSVTDPFEYFKHTSYTSVFRNLDGMIRRRLRRLLLKRHGHHHYNGRGMAHYRWPNAYFVEHGLFSMEAAHVRLHQSVVR